MAAGAWSRCAGASLLKTVESPVRKVILWGRIHWIRVLLALVLLEVVPLEVVPEGVPLGAVAKVEALQLGVSNRASNSGKHILQNRSR